jgi:hypothetical protein
MKKLTFRTISEVELEQKNGYSLVPASEGTYGEHPFDDDSVSDDVVRWDSKTMTWSTGGNVGHHCITLEMAKDVTEENGS